MLDNLEEEKEIKLDPEWKDTTEEPVDGDDALDLGNKNEDDVSEKFDGEQVKGNKPGDEMKQEEKENNSNIEIGEVSEVKLMTEEEKEIFFGNLLEDFKKTLYEVNKPFLENLEKMKFSG